MFYFNRNVPVFQRGGKERGEERERERDRDRDRDRDRASELILYSHHIR